MDEADTKTCPICAEEVKAAAQRCRYCGHDFTGLAASGRQPAPVIVIQEKRRRGCWVIVAVVLLIGAVGVTIEDMVKKNSAPPPRDPAPCDHAVAQAQRDRIVRRVNGNRIDVEDLSWATAPADGKRSLMALFLCSHLRGRSPTQSEDYVVAYGYRSGRRVAMAGEFGVTLE